MISIYLVDVASQVESTNPFQQAISSYKLGFHQYLGNAMGAVFVIMIVVLILGAVDFARKWWNKSQKR